MPAIRSAEKQRTSTCPFADRIANLSITEYKRRRGISTFDGVQTVLAAILVHDSASNDLRVLSFGVGTKILSSSIASSDHSGHRIRDCHAEVGTHSIFEVICIEILSRSWLGEDFYACCTLRLRRF